MHTIEYPILCIKLLLQLKQNYKKQNINFVHKLLLSISVQLRGSQTCGILTRIVHGHRHCHRFYCGSSSHLTCNRCRCCPRSHFCRRRICRYLWCKEERWNGRWPKHRRNHERGRGWGQRDVSRLQVEEVVAEFWQGAW